MYYEYKYNDKHISVKLTYFIFLYFYVFYSTINMTIEMYVRYNHYVEVVATLFLRGKQRVRIGLSFQGTNSTVIHGH